MTVQVHPPPSTYKAASELLDGLQEAAEKFELDITLVESRKGELQTAIQHYKPVRKTRRMVSVVESPSLDLEIFFLQYGKELHSMPDQQHRKWTSTSILFNHKFTTTTRKAKLQKFRDKDKKFALAIKCEGKNPFFLFWCE
eukprot:GHVS01072354.1.p1 GENE.GHVS01072354.1~~GHVS01072354.1.p1  ORF type:complete len:141 (+),score=6.84 GHVS01072354.1:413-835(+)